MKAKRRIMIDREVDLELDTTCEYCYGKGKIVSAFKKDEKIYEGILECPLCKGTGEWVPELFKPLER